MFRSRWSFKENLFITLILIFIQHQRKQKKEYKSLPSLAERWILMTLNELKIILSMFIMHHTLLLCPLLAFTTQIPIYWESEAFSLKQKIRNVS